MTISRRTMKFLVPLTIESLGRNDLTGRSVVPIYINPSSFSLQDSKIISETLTKGGFSVQYWGENLGEIQAAGTTGSAGIEGINLLRAVYRNEITQFNNILLERSALLDQTAREALENTSTAGIGSGIASILDEVTQGGFTGIIDGTKSAIQEITDAARGLTDDNPASVELIPTIGAFATNMILYWQGEKFIGYFKNFRSEESAQSPGLFDYQFSFMITKRSGTRTNFMPWHRKPTDASGQAIEASTPSQGAREDELNFQTTTQQNIQSFQANPLNPNIPDSLTSTFSQTEGSVQNDVNRVNISRNAFIKGN